MSEKLELSGYEQHKEVLAQRYRKGPVRWVYVISLPLHLVPSHLPIPNPDTPFPGNRRVNKLHAERFGDYWRKNKEWATPPILVDTLYPLADGFDTKFEVAGVEFGVLKLPHNSAGELDILDGQHRILGWASASERIASELKTARARLQESRVAEDAIGTQHYESEVSRLMAEQARLHNEYVTIEVLQGITPEEHKQIFNDIAVNAKGIAKSVTVSFDRRMLLNRVAMDFAENNPLLAGRVDLEKDRIAGQNENLISGRNLVDLVRHVTLGIDGRMTARREGDMKETSVADLFEAFLAALVDSFPDLQRVQDEELEVSELRSLSMLASATMLRVLAGAYHSLAVDLSDETRPSIRIDGDTRARALFSALSGHMGFPLEDGWMATGLFPDEDSKAPSSRAQDLRSLCEIVTSWAYGSVPFPS